MTARLLILSSVAICLASCSPRPPQPPQNEILGQFINTLPPEFSGWKLIPDSGGGSTYGSTLNFKIELIKKDPNTAIHELRSYFRSQLEGAGLDISGSGTVGDATALRNFSFRLSTPRSVGTVSVATYPIGPDTILATVAIAQVGLPL